MRIGGVNLQYCPKKKLCRAEDWVSNIIPIAVDPKDSSLSEVNTIEELKKVNWKDVILFMQNGKGRTLRPNKDLPSYRLLSEISAKSTITFLENKSYEFTFDKMMKMRNSCHALYRFIWNDVSGLEEPEYQTDEQIVFYLLKRNFSSEMFIQPKRKKQIKERFLPKQRRFPLPVGLKHSIKT